MPLYVLLRTGGSPQALGAVCMLTVVLALLVLQVVWLFGAIKASDQAAHQQYAMQYWQYAQQQQGYAQPGYPPPITS